MIRVAVTVALLAASASAQPWNDWRELEAPLLTGHIRLTSPDMFTKAGEAYFSPDTNWIIFQAVPVPPEGQEPSPHYAMYVAKLTRDADGAINGIEEPIELSGPGSANTCGWFHPTKPGVVLFGSTVEPLVKNEGPGFRVGTEKYSWDFPTSMNIIEVNINDIINDGISSETLAQLPRLVDRPGYDAEGSWSSDGALVLYANVDESKNAESADADIWIRDLESGKDIPMVIADGYDGGPFFNPDDTLICYRSDRNGDEHLQLYITEVERNDSGTITGPRREVQLTDDGHDNWAPFFHPGGESLIYTTSRMGHRNYEVFGIELALDKVHSKRQLRRITLADGFDGLSVFSPDGRQMMWTSQRNLDGAPGAGPSQVWIATIADKAGSPAFHSPLDRPQAELLAIRQAEKDGHKVDPLSIKSEPFRRQWIVTISPLGTGDPLTYSVTPDGLAEAMAGGS